MNTTPAERLELAIAKLEQLKTESTPGTWVAVRSASDSFSWIEVPAIADIAQLDDANHAEDADLIVILHRTIDAQLAILRDALNAFDNPIPAFMGREEQIYAAQLALAVAVLGGTE